MFKFRIAEETSLPRWLEAQASAAAPANTERERLLRKESKDEKLVCHSHARTAAIIATLLCVMGLLGVLLYLTYEATGVFRSARDSVGTKVTTLMNLTEAMALDTRMAINSLRGASRNAELFTVHSFEHLENASAHIHDLSEFICPRCLFKIVSVRRFAARARARQTRARRSRRPTSALPPTPDQRLYPRL